MTAARTNEREVATLGSDVSIRRGKQEPSEVHLWRDEGSVRERRVTNICLQGT